jgi:hypothetical protein
MPEQWPPGSEDLKELITNADTITYMAEFFTECVEKIKTRLGPCSVIFLFFSYIIRQDNN